jgi:predicted RNA-binding Zn-ribbon protein involved in translation (DUF1610 family)
LRAFSFFRTKISRRELVFMQIIHNPPEGYKPSPKTHTAWCPYCGAAKEFVHDAALDTCRCSGCGISTEDFYVRRHNGFWDEDTKRKFDSAVKSSGKKWPREKKKDVWEPRDPGITWEPPEEKTELHPAVCPACGEEVRLAVFPLKDERCHRCGAVFSQEKPDGEAEIHEKPLSCRACGRFLTDRPEPGAAYMCPSCGEWTEAHEKRSSRAAPKKPTQKTGPIPITENKRFANISHVGISRLSGLAECSKTSPAGGKAVFDPHFCPGRYKTTC